jgi:hypothetical protein
VSVEAEQFEFEAREVVFRADFDYLDAIGCVWVSLHFTKGPDHPRKGDWVYLLDGRGGGCTGTCEAVHGWLAQVRPEWESWLGGSPPPLQPEPGKAHLRLV